MNCNRKTLLYYRSDAANLPAAGLIDLKNAKYVCFGVVDVASSPLCKRSGGSRADVCVPWRCCWLCYCQRYAFHTRAGHDGTRPAQPKATVASRPVADHAVTVVHHLFRVRASPGDVAVHSAGAVTVCGIGTAT